MQATFTFNADTYPELSLPNNLADDCAISNSCGCCWEISMPATIEFEFREWLERSNSVPTSFNYVNPVLKETETWLNLENIQANARTFNILRDGSKQQQVINRQCQIILYRQGAIFATYEFAAGTVCPVDIYQKGVELYIDMIEDYKPFICQLANWSLSTNLFWGRSLCAPDTLEPGEHSLFTLEIDRKKEMECIIAN